MPLCRSRTRQIEAVRRQADHGELRIDTAPRCEGMGQGDAFVTRWRTVGPQGRHEIFGTLPPHFVLRKRGQVDNAGAVANGKAFRAYGIEPAGTAERQGRDLSVRLPGEPQRPLPAIGRSHDRTLRKLPLIGWCRTARTPGLALLIGVMDAELQAEALDGLVEAIGAVGISPEAAGIDRQRIARRPSVDDPVGQEGPCPAALHDAHAGTRQEPNVGQAEGRSHQRIPVGCEGDRPVDDALDSCRRERRHALHRHCDDMLDAVEIGRKEFHPEFRRHAVNGPGMGGLLVRAHDVTIAFLTQIPALLGIADDRKFGAACGNPVRDFPHRIRHDILMKHRDDGKVDAHHVSELPAPRPGCVHDMLGDDLPLLRLDEPLARRCPTDRMDGIVPHNLGAPRPRSRRHRIRGERWVDMPVIGLVDRAEDPVGHA